MDPWDRLPDENDQEWRAFSAYLLAGLHRSFQQSGLPLADTLKLASKHNWVSRAREWDKHLAGFVTQSAQDEAKTQGAALGREAAEAASMAVSVALNGLRGLLVRQTSGDGTAEIVPVQTLVKLLQAGVQVHRLLNGESTENLSINVGDLTDEELALLRKK